MQCLDDLSPESGARTLVAHRRFDELAHRLIKADGHDDQPCPVEEEAAGHFEGAIAVLADFGGRDNDLQRARLLERLGKLRIFTGDNPDASTDSRTTGPAARGDVVGIVRARYKPVRSFRMF